MKQVQYKAFKWAFPSFMIGRVNVAWWGTTNFTAAPSSSEGSKEVNWKESFSDFTPGNEQNIHYV
jgi:hypothetical protein